MGKKHQKTVSQVAYAHDFVALTGVPVKKEAFFVCLNTVHDVSED